MGEIPLVSKELHPECYVGEWSAQRTVVVDLGAMSQVWSVPTQVPTVQLPLRFPGPTSG